VEVEREVTPESCELMEVLVGWFSSSRAVGGGFRGRLSGSSPSFRGSMMIGRRRSPQPITEA